MKKVILAAAFVMGLVTVSFAGNPKETKTETPTTATSEVTTGELYWYKVSYVGNPSGYIPANAPLQAHDVQENVIADCEAGSTRDCFRGFEVAQTAMTTSAGQGQIKTDEQP